MQRPNPAGFKRKIDEKIHRLFKVYEEKQGGGAKASPSKKQTPQVAAKSYFFNGTTTPASVT